MNVELEDPGHLYWPELDVDLAVESIEHPDRFPLVSQVRPNSELQPTAGTRRVRKLWPSGLSAAAERVSVNAISLYRQDMGR